jgi:hypothetical protein
LQKGLKVLRDFLPTGLNARVLFFNSPDGGVLFVVHHRHFHYFGHLSAEELNEFDERWREEVR